MANELTKQDLLMLVNMITGLVNKSTEQRTKLYDAKLIDNNQLEFLSNEETKLLNEANRAANTAIGNIATNLTSGSAATVLQKTTADLQGVIEQLKQFNIFIGIFKKLIDVFSRINQVIAAGGATVAVISSLVDDLTKLANPERGDTDSYVPGDI